MKRIRQILAMAGVILLLTMYLLTFVFAMMKSPAAQAMFRGALGCTILVPVFAYLVQMVARVVKPQRSPVCDTVIFDIGNVLIDFRWKEYAAELGFSEEIIAYLDENVLFSPIWTEFDYGIKDYEDIIESLCEAHPSCQKEIRTLVGTLENACTPFWYTEEWIRGLKRKGYRVLYLSNWSRLIHDRMVSNGSFDFLKHMDGGIWSFEEHCIKPEPDIFRALIAKYSLDPSRCIFLDDNEPNIAAARKEGLGAVLFTGYPDAQEKLAEIGITW